MTSEPALLSSPTGNFSRLLIGQHDFTVETISPVPILDFWGPYAKLCRGGMRMDETHLSVFHSVSKALVEQYLFRGSYKLVFFVFF